MESSIPKTIYLHIGTSKTGTSALQYFLLKNRDVLSHKGINYPEHLLDINQFSSSGNAKWIYYSLKRNDISHIRKYIGDIANTTHSSVLLSSELLGELLEEYIVKLKEILTDFNNKVIIYLRRQDYWLMSAYQQQVKTQSVTSNIDDWFTGEHKRGRYWYKQVRRWARLFGKENLIVRPYEVQQFVGGNIFSDFLNIFGLDLQDGFEVPQKRVNVAYRTDALEIMRLLNMLPQTNYSNLYLLLQRYSDHFGKEGDWPYTLFSPAKRHEIVKLYDQANQAIAKEYLGRSDGQLFYDPLPGPDEPWKPYPGLSDETFLQIVEFILRHDIKTSMQIKKVISQGLMLDGTRVSATANGLLLEFSKCIDKRLTLWYYIKYYAYRLLDIIRRSKIKRFIFAVLRRLRIVK